MGKKQKREARWVQRLAIEQEARADRISKLLQSNQEQVCPTCGERQAVAILYGDPLFGDAEFEAEYHAGIYWLGGCVFFVESPNWHCRACGHEWRST